MKPIGYIYTDFDDKFGIPRQSGLIDLPGVIEFLPEFRQPEAFRGLEGYSHIWVLWEFSSLKREGFSATVKPPRLGGNRKMGVFATRSPYRPNPIGLSCLKLEKVECTENKGVLLHVSGVDMLNKTPIYDVKPYIAYADSHPDAVCGFADEVMYDNLKVIFPDELLNELPENIRDKAIKLLELDPRPHYIDDPERKYGVSYAGYDIRFKVLGDLLTVCEVELL